MSPRVTGCRYAMIASVIAKAHDALLKKDWSTACDLADEIVVAARELKIFNMHQLELELEASFDGRN